MKRVAVLAVALLSGCAMFTSRPFDSTEYDHAITISDDTIHTAHRCDNTSSSEFLQFSQDLNLESLHLVQYVSNKPDSTQALPIANQLRQEVKEFTTRQNYSKSYCQHKISNIQASARTFARTTSHNTEYDVCRSNVASRYTLFAASYKNGELSKDEFGELVRDLLKLKTIDTNGCTLETREQLEISLHLIENAASLLGAI